MKRPIACSLDAPDARSQLDEWRHLFHSMVATVEWVDPTSLRMRLHDETDAIAPLIDLARREVACCPFFRFALEIDAQGIAFVASVPPDAVQILQDFALLAER